MQRTLLLLVVALGMSACVGTLAPTDPGICTGLRGDVAELRRQMLAHPETPAPVGEAGTNVVIGFQAGCRR